MKVKVSIYDEEHRRLLSSYPTVNYIKQINEKELYIPEEDFLIYCLFIEQKDFDGYRTFEDLKSIVSYRIEWLKEYLDLSYTIRGKFPSKYQPKEITERVGVGCSLLLISKIHNLTEADWKIKEISSEYKDLDFYISSDENHIIEVECKGTYKDPNIKPSKQKKSIEEKKETQRRLNNNSHKILYGVITSYYNKSDKLAHLRLLDPESNNKYGNPLKLKILSRLYFYLFVLNLFSRSHFLIALANRIEILKILAADQIEKLNGIPLKNARGEDFDFPISLKFFKNPLPNKDYIGILFESTRQLNSYYFIGVHKDIVNILIKQKFSELVRLRFQPKTEKISSFKARIKKEEILLTGKIMMSSSGVLLGDFSPRERE